MIRWFLLVGIFAAVIKPVRAENVLLEKASDQIPMGKVYNYTLTSAVVFGVAAGTIAWDENGSVPVIAVSMIGGGVLGGYLAYPRHYVLTNQAEKILFPIIQGLLLAYVLGTTGVVVGWEWIDKPNNREFPNTGLGLGVVGLVSGGVGGGVLGFQLAKRF